MKEPQIRGVVGLLGVLCVTAALWFLDWRVGLGAFGLLALWESRKTAQ